MTRIVDSHSETAPARGASPARAAAGAAGAARKGAAPGRRLAAARIPASRSAGPRLPRRLAPRKLPTQARARTTVEAILQAAVQLFSSRGYARTNTNQIARRAGVSVGSLYQYFPNKDALLTALLDRHLASVREAVAESLPALGDPSVPLRQAVRRLLERLRDVHDADPALSRAVEQQAGQMPVVPQALSGHKREHLEEVERALSARPDVRGGDHALMAALLTELTETASGWLVHGRPREADPGLALAEAVEALCRYVERRDA